MRLMGKSDKVDADSQILLVSTMSMNTLWDRMNRRLLCEGGLRNHSSASELTCLQEKNLTIKESFVLLSLAEIA